MRLKVLKQISELENRLEGPVTKEEEKQINEKIEQLGKRLTIPRRTNRIEQIKRKAENTTKEDIVTLKNYGFSMKEISEVTGLTKYKMNQILNQMSQTERKVRLERAKDLLESTNLPVSVIIKRTGAVAATVYSYSRRIRNKSAQR